MSYDPLRQRVKDVKATLAVRIRRAKEELRDAKTRLGLLEELEISLNLEAIEDLLPEEGDAA